MAQETAGGDALEVELEGIEERASEPERFELSAGVGLRLGGTFGGANLGSLEMLPIVGDVGFPLGSRALFVVGLSVSLTTSVIDSFVASVPIGVLVYLDAPRVSAFVPFVRAGVVGTLSESNAGAGGLGALAGPDYWGLGALVRGGLTWFPIERLGIRAELGARADVFAAGAFTSFAVGLDGAASLVLRI